MNEIFVLSSVAVILGISQPAHSQDECPPNADPVYCRLANETGGKVYVGDPQDAVDDIMERDFKAAKREKENPKHEYSPYSRDLGCDTQTENRTIEICKSIESNLEWGWTGHAMIAPAWRITPTTLRNVYCETEISAQDLPILKSMCNYPEFLDHNICSKPDNRRLAQALEDLINLIAAQSNTDAETITTIYNPRDENYILKDGCGAD
ncbi:MAG TPA: hypothetical protein PLK94_09875 [Alphaproteobacteria bacterium]|nr:hypothetical protein [Alphaproteobacteria bacterium]HOO51580.1 hypothetical protein [Alphaproteobacteria bacterium]